jgi:hypothetical protein
LYEGFQENDKIRVNQTSQSMKETAKLQSSATQQNLQNNLPGGGEREKEKNCFDPGVLNSAGDARLQESDSLSLINQFQTFQRKLAPSSFKYHEVHDP